jgi:hypothetical protein
MITSNNGQTNKVPVGNGINQPELYGQTTNLIRPSQPDSLKGGSLTDSPAASSENLSAKYKYPNKTVDASPELLNEYL